MGSVSVGTVSIFVCLHVGRRCEYSFACMRVGTYACVYVCLSSTSMCQGRALDSASLIILVDPHPTTMLCRWRDAAGALVISRAGAGCSGERRPTLGGRLAGPGPTGLAGPRLGGWGAFGLRAQGPVRPGVVGCRWSLRACRHGTLGRLHCGCRRSRLRALLCPFWVEAAVVPAVVLLGVPCPGGPPDVWGPGLFRACFMPCGMGLLFPTHTIKRLHGGTLWTQARSHTQVYTQAFTLV